ncbi:MAG: type II secretion system protein [Fidelibacterota bacterium]
MKREHGFTLIELIMVMVILGILASVIVPRFFDFTSDAHKAHVQAFVGNLKSALELKASNTILETGYKSYPKGSHITDFTVLLDQFPDEWSIQSVDANTVDFIYSGDASYPDGVKVRYESDGNDSYVLKIKTAAYGWNEDDEF